MLRGFIVSEDVIFVYNDTFKYSSLSTNTCIPTKFTVWIHPYQLHIVPFKILPIHKFTTFHSKTHIRQEILQVMLKQFSSCSENVCVMHFSSWLFHDIWLSITVVQKEMWHDQGEWVRCRKYWFWDTGIKRWQIFMFYIVFDLQRIVHISAARCPVEMGFGSKCSILNEKVIDIKN